MDYTSHTPGISSETIVKTAAETEKKIESEESKNNNDPFANGKGDDPHARGAESSYDFIKNNC